jgi:hypothetical protein
VNVPPRGEATGRRNVSDALRRPAFESLRQANLATLIEAYEDIHHPIDIDVRSKTKTLSFNDSPSPILRRASSVGCRVGQSLDQSRRQRKRAAIRQFDHQSFECAALSLTDVACAAEARLAMPRTRKKSRSILQKIYLLLDMTNDK